MSRMLSIFDGYTATAASGWSESSDEIDVDVIPLGSGGADVTPGNIWVPMVAEDESGHMVPIIVIGWDQTPAKLYVTTGWPHGLVGAVTIRCAPSSAVQYSTQSAESFSDTLDVVNDAYFAWHGATHYLEIEDPCEITIAGYRVAGYGGSSVARPFGLYEPGYAEGQRTTMILHDVASDQPTLTWATDADNISWEDGDPQFSAGKTRMVVEVVGNADQLYGWFHLFA